MFFAPPEVKSLSRYSQFGSHDAGREFAITLAVTLLLHLVIIGIYSMAPREEIVKIPVRVLNIKFSGDSAGEEDAQEAGSPARPSRDVPYSSSLSQGVAGVGGKYSTENDKNQVIEIINKGIGKKPLTKQEENNNSPSSSKPRKYVREGQSEVDIARSGNGKGNGSGITGSRGGEEIVARYTQEISLLVEKHKKLNQNLDGKTLLRVRVNRQGNIIFRKIEVSSTNEAIDKAALDMIDDTGKLPFFPEDYPEDEMEFLLPVNFILQ